MPAQREASVGDYPANIFVPRDLGNKRATRKPCGKAFITFAAAAGESLEAVVEHIVDLAAKHKLYVHTEFNEVYLTCSPSDTLTKERKIRHLLCQYEESRQLEIDKCDHEWISRPWDQTKSILPPPPRCSKCLAIEPAGRFHHRWLENLGMITGYEWWNYATQGAKTYQEGVKI